MKPSSLLLLSAALAASGGASRAGSFTGQAWGANLGWAVPSTSAGLLAGPGGARVLFGPLYLANCGWLALGDGTPANGIQYANTTGADHGVNFLPDGSLRGLAWSANLGWVNFEVTGNPRLDAATGQFSGHAWIANAGWLRLDGLTMSGQPPTPQPDTYSRAPGSTLKVTPAQVLANDSDPVGAELALVSVQNALPAGATVELSEGWILYTPPAGYAGSGSFTYKVMNPDLREATALVTVHIQANPDAETPNRLAFEVQADGSVYLRYAGVPGRTYTIQAAVSLKAPVIWSPLGLRTAAIDGTFDWLDTDAPSFPQRFYRTEAPANP
jgi:hypothetical protein